MTTDGQTLMTGFSEFLDDLWQSTTTALGSTTTLEDAAANDQFGREGMVGGFTRIREGAAINEVRRVSGFTGGVATVLSPYSVAIASGIDYEWHKYDPEKKFRALDRARVLAFPQLAVLQIDETLTADGLNYELDIPSTMRKGPMQVWAEEPIDPRADWQLLTNGALTSTTGWTATTLTASVLTRNTFDRIVPRQETSCVKLVGNGTLTQTIANMVTGMSAAMAAGRDVAFGVWVYSRTAGVTAFVTDDAGTSTSTAHLGRGWQFLQVTRSVSATNATILTVGIATNANITVYVERAYAGFMKRIPVLYPRYVSRLGVQRDNTTQRVYLDASVSRGLQLRLVGRSMLSALGTDPVTQLINTMEVDELNADLLYATAARILLVWEGWSTDAVEGFPKIQAAMARWKEQVETSRVKYPRSNWLTV